MSNTKTVQDRCTRCGECCRNSSPALLKKDIPLLNNSIGYHEIYTIRRGELVADNIKEKPVHTDHELIKIKEKHGIKGGCIFYDESENSCLIHSQKPSQCSALKCWDTEDFMENNKGPRLKRTDIIPNTVLTGLIQEHEKRCSYSLLEKEVSKIQSQGEKPLNRIIDILKFDHELRPFISKKLNLNLHEMDLYFGRPLTETIKMFGLQVNKEKDGTFFLTMEPHG